MTARVRKTREEAVAFTVAPDGSWIECGTCHRRSYHPEDVKQLYCGACNKFHKMNAAEERRRINASLARLGARTLTPRQRMHAGFLEAQGKSAKGLIRPAAEKKGCGNG